VICREKSQLDATQWFIELIIRSTCFGHYMPTIRSSRLYRWLQHVAHNTLFKAGRGGLVWGCRLCVQSNSPQPGRIV